MLVAGNRIREEKKGRGTRAHIGPHEVELQSEARLGMPFCLVFTLDLQDRRWGRDLGDRVWLGEGRSDWMARRCHPKPVLRLL